MSEPVKRKQGGVGHARGDVSSFQVIFRVLRAGPGLIVRPVAARQAGRPVDHCVTVGLFLPQ